MRNDKVFKLTVTAVMAALSYVAFAFIQIRIPLPGGGATSFHLGNAVCVLAALLLGGTYGGLAGALGMTIGDILDPIYIIYAPRTFILKFCIGLVTGLIAHKIGRITYSKDRKYVVKWTVIASIGGMLFNVVFDPVFGFFYNILVIGRTFAQAWALPNVLTTSVNAVASVIVAVLLYLPVRKALIKANMFVTVGKETDKKVVDNDEENTSDK